jgi:hypothetical protein
MGRMNRRFLYARIAVINLIFLLGALVIPAFPAVKIKLLTVNPSVDQKQKVPVRYDFPQEVQKDDIIDAGGMDIDYDVTSNKYYAYKEIELAPKATYTFQIIVADKWDIPADELDSMRDKLTEKLKGLEGTDQYETAKMLADKIQGRLDTIAKTQQEAGGDVVRKIDLNRINRQTLVGLENDILSLEYLANRAVPVEEARSIKYVIEADNPSDKPLETKITHFLPKGIQAQYVVSSGGFDVRYDSDLDQLYLEKEETFKPGEKKRFEIEIKDLWYFPEKMLTSYREQADGLETELSGTKFKSLANLLYKEIIVNLDEIKNSQAEARSLKDRIALYQINSEKEKKIKKNLDKLKIVLADALKHTVLREVKPMAQLKIIEYLKKVAPKVEVFRVVLYILVFVILLTVLATWIWLQRMKREDAQKYKKIEKAKEEVKETKQINI